MTSPAPFLVAAGLFLSSLGAVQASCQPEAVLQNYFQAFNAHESEGIGELVTDNFEWYTVIGGEAVLELSGRSKLVEWLDDYFAKRPDVQSKMEGIIVDGCMASIRERASWNQDGQSRSQTALSSYQIQDRKMRRIWYIVASD